MRGLNLLIDLLFHLRLSRKPSARSTIDEINEIYLQIVQLLEQYRNSEEGKLNPLVRLLKDNA